MENHVTNPNSNEYKLTAIVFDIAHNILFKPVAIKKNEIEHNKSAKSKIPLCVKDQAVNYKNVFQDVKSKHAEWICAYSSFIYNHAVHVKTGDHNIINSNSLRDVFSTWPIYREPKFINWEQNFQGLCKTRDKTWKGGHIYSFRMG